MPKEKLANTTKAFDTLRIKYKDIFDLKEFYDAMHEWLFEHEWVDKEDKMDHWESYYDERVNQGGAKEIRIYWRLFKHNSTSEYINYYLDISWKCLAITKVEIVRDGQKMKVNKGEIELTIEGSVEELYKGFFKNNKILKHLVGLFSKRIYKETLEQHKKELYQEAYEMNNFIKQWFKMKRYLPYEETRSFFPSAAWPSHVKEDK